MLYAPGPVTASSRKPPAMVRFFMNIREFTPSAKLLWKMNAVSTVKPAVNSAVVRVRKPNRTARPPPIPVASIDKAPSAELRPNQTDQDSLPPYDVLDAVLRVLIDAEGSVDDAVRDSGAPRELVLRIARMLDRAQFKRDQAAVILKLTPRAFGRGRRYPIAQRWGW